MAKVILQEDAQDASTHVCTPSPVPGVPRATAGIHAWSPCLVHARHARPHVGDACPASPRLLARGRTTCTRSASFAAMDAHYGQVSWAARDFSRLAGWLLEVVPHVTMLATTCRIRPVSRLP